MDARYDPDQDAPIGALFTRLLDDGQRLVRAELKLARATASFRASQSVVGIAMLAFAILLAQACVTVFLVGIFVWLSRMIGPIGSTLAVTLVGLGICGLLAKIGIGKVVKAVTLPIPGTEQAR